MKYMAENLLRLAKRQNNTKRSYLLVNPLQGKHMPVSPKASLDMMESLGKQLAAAYPGTRLVIGFAETATAIGAVVAGCFGETCIYIHTTRENMEDVKKWVYFQEEHSHAVEQKLCSDCLAQWIKDTPQVMFVDDELSTGKTLRNIVLQLRNSFPELEGKTVVAASIINRLTEENEELLKKAGIVSECLLRLPDEDYTAAVKDYHITEAEDFRKDNLPGIRVETIKTERFFMNPRAGVLAKEYQRDCQDMADKIWQAVKKNMENAECLSHEEAWEDGNRKLGESLARKHENKRGFYNNWSLKAVENEERGNREESFQNRLSQNLGEKQKEGKNEGSFPGSLSQSVAEIQKEGKNEGSFPGSLSQNVAEIQKGEKNEDSFPGSLSQSVAEIQKEEKNEGSFPGSLSQSVAENQEKVKSEGKLHDSLCQSIAEHCQEGENRGNFHNSLCQERYGNKEKKVLVLGTEECMYPALILGRRIEESGAADSVVCHATTRSPIGICKEEGYPVVSGCKIRSFYSEDRETYLYNLNAYDIVIVVSDADRIGNETCYVDKSSRGELLNSGKISNRGTTNTDRSGNSGIVDLAKAVCAYGCRTLLYVPGGKYV